MREWFERGSNRRYQSFQPGGAVDLVKLASAFISPDLRPHVMPTFSRLLAIGASRRKRPR